MRGDITRIGQRVDNADDGNFLGHFFQFRAQAVRAESGIRLAFPHQMLNFPFEVGMVLSQTEIQ